MDGGRTDGRTDRRADGQTGGRADRRADGRMDGQIGDYARADERAGGRTDGRADTRADERTDGRTGRTTFLVILGRITSGGIVTNVCMRRSFTTASISPMTSIGLMNLYPIRMLVTNLPNATPITL